MPLYSRMLQEQGSDMNSLLALNTDDAYADNGVLYLTAALFGFRIDVYSGSDLTTPTVSYNRTRD